MIPALYQIQSALVQATQAIETVNRLATSNGRELVKVYELMSIQQDLINALGDRVARLEAGRNLEPGEN